MRENVKLLITLVFAIVLALLLSDLRTPATNAHTTFWSPWSPISPIDIKPGSDPSSINCKNKKQVITVALLSTSDLFDATTVDHTTVTFEGASETHVDKKSGEPRRHEEDVDSDGYTDLVFHFRLGDTNLTCDSTEGTLTGMTFSGQTVTSTGDVHMVDPGRGRR